VLADRQRLCMVYAEQKMHTKKNAFFSLERTLAGMNPLTVLTRGYGIVRKNKKIISGVSQISSGDDIDIQFSDGSLTARVHSPQRTLPL
jgi:exodeoxyribonuclease VII large subunit